MLVYFAKPVGMDGPIKIGCSNRPARRILDLAPWVPFPLELLVTIPGDYRLELNIQECFTAARRHSEWFEATPELVEAIRKLKAGVPVEQAIDLSKRQGRMRSHKRTPEQRLRASYTHRLRCAAERLRKLNGQAWVYFLSPSRANDIVHYWRRNERPSADDMAYLEAVLADPVAHYRRHEIPAQKPKIAA